MTTAAKIQIINGAFQNAIGQPIAGGSLTFVLNQDSQVNGNTEIGMGYRVSVPLDSNGNVPSSPAQYLWPNDVLSPSGSFYTLYAYTSKGQLVWGPNSVVIPSGGSGLSGVVTTDDNTTFDLGYLSPPSDVGGNGNGCGSTGGSGNCPEGDCSGCGCPVQVSSSTYNIPNTGEQTYLFSAAGGTATLPLASSMSPGAFLFLKNISTGTFIIQANAADTIESNSEIEFYGQYDYIVLQSDCQSTWYIWGESISPVP